jgi:hypothetical protein
MILLKATCPYRIGGNFSILRLEDGLHDVIGHNMRGRNNLPFLF